MENPVISLLMPSRNRPGSVAHLVQSMRSCSSLPIQVVVRVDGDEHQMPEYERLRDAGVIDYLAQGPRLVMSDLWNDAARYAAADIMMLCGDDLLWRTPGWDRMVLDAFAACPDKILLVYGSDGHHQAGYATHPLIHRRWYEAVGRFTGPYFSSDYADTWLWEVSGMVGRRKYLPFLTEHMHYAFGKGGIDVTMQENIDRRARDNPAKLFVEKLPERQAEAARLKAAIAGFKPDAPVAPVSVAVEVESLYRAENFSDKGSLSILIPCLTVRRASARALIASLVAQAQAGNFPVEILTLTDDGKMSVGAKRNALVAAAKGDYTCFCDDDDRVFGDYLELIFSALRGGVDCVALTTLVTFNEGTVSPRLDRLTFGSMGHPPVHNCGIHLCPTRRAITRAVPFESVNWGEDANWALAVRPLIKTHVTILKPVYHYDFNARTTATQQPGMVNHARGAFPNNRLRR